MEGYEGRTPKPRESDVLALERLFEDKLPAMELPSLGSWTFPSSDDPAVLDVDGHRNNASTIIDGGQGLSVDEDDVFVNDPPSLTLKELLLTADTGQFESLGMCAFCHVYFLYPDTGILSRCLAGRSFGQQFLGG
jgi:hypothetical protein